MRQEIITKTYLNFDELNKEQQQKVIDSFREDVHHDFEDFMANDTYYNFKELLSIIGFVNVTINYSGFCSQGDGASFTGTYFHDDSPENILRAIKSSHLDYILEGTDIMEYLGKIENCEGVEEVYRVGRYYHENSIYCENESVQLLAREISRTIYEELESQYEYLHTDEYIEERMKNNHYEFDSETLELV